MTSDLNPYDSYLRSIPSIKLKLDYQFLNSVKNNLKINRGGHLDSRCAILSFRMKVDPNVIIVIFFIWMSGSDFEDETLIYLHDFPEKIKNYFTIGRKFAANHIQQNSSREIWEDMALEIYQCVN